MKYLNSIDMNGNEIINCKTIDDFEKRMAALEMQVQVQPKKLIKNKRIKGFLKRLVGG